MSEERKSIYGVDKIFVDRYSTRLFSEKEVTKDEINKLFEAASFAPSTANNQPWRYVYAKKGTEQFDEFLKLLVEQNQKWVVNAGLIVFVLGYKRLAYYNNMEYANHLFDTGLSCSYLALQSYNMNLGCHFMAGLDYKGAHEYFTKGLENPDDYSVVAAVAIGHNAEDVSSEKKSLRKKVEEICFENVFTGDKKN
jgi:nitroreductase